MSQRRNFRNACFAIVFLVTSVAAAAHAQTTSRGALPIHRLRVFLLTFGPGADPWEKFGHDAIAIIDADTGDGLAYNWGIFDFGQGMGGFLSFSWHFAQGRLVYSMQSEPIGDILSEYREANRSILLQELKLTTPQKRALQARLVANDTDANRYYLYDYFHKNCATMARDAIDQTVDGRVRAALDHLPTGITYRWQDRRTCADTLWLYLFLDFALGHPVDRKLSAWQECFLPGKLAEHLQDVNVPGAEGKLVPLVSESRVLNVGVFRERNAPPASFVYRFLIAGLSAGGCLTLLAGAGRDFKLAKWSFYLLGCAWSLLAGGLGALLTFAWFTNHDAAKWNENWFQGNPLSLLLIVLVPLAWHWPRAARTLALAVLALSVLGLIFKISPWGWQSNWTIIAIALPIHAAIAWGVGRLNHLSPQKRVIADCPDGKESVLT